MRFLSFPVRQQMHAACQLPCGDNIPKPMHLQDYRDKVAVLGRHACRPLGAKPVTFWQSDSLRRSCVPPRVEQLRDLDSVRGRTFAQVVSYAP